MKLFPDQVNPVAEAVAYLKAGKNVLLLGPTGSGKTVMGADVVYQLGMKAVFIVNKITLLSQAYDTLTAHGVKAAVFHNSVTKNVAGDVMNTDWANADVIITLIETFENAQLDFVPALIVLDECHKSTSVGYQNFRDRCPEALVLGLTATPGRLKNKSGESLGEWYDVMVVADTCKALIEKGRLARPVYKVRDETANVVEAWLELTEGDSNRRTIMFVKNASHMIALKKAFAENGITAEYISSGSDLEDVKDEIAVTTNEQRNELFRRFKAGTLEILISFGVLCEGFDEPLAKYCFLLRKVSHVSLLHQMIGRVLRSAAGKENGVIVDLFGNIEDFGPIEEYKWEMDGSGYKDSVLVQDGSVVYYGNFARKPQVYVVCAECTHVYDIAKEDTCPCCDRLNKVKISASFKQLKDYFMLKIDPVAWARHSKFAKKGDEFWAFLEIVAKAIKAGRQNEFNRVQFELFETDGSMIKEYRWMQVALDNMRKLKSDSKVEFVI